VSDDKDELDPSDWLASQFDPTAEVPKQKPPAEPPVGAPPAAAAPLEPPPFVAPPAEPPHQGGFNWGLRPGGAAEPPPSAPPPSAPEPPTTPYLPPEPPTTPYVPPAPPPLVAPPLPPVPPSVPPPLPPNPADVPTQAVTQPMSLDDLNAITPPPLAQQPSVDQPTEAYTVQPWDPFETTPAESATPAAPTTPAAPNPPTDAAPTSALDALFGESQFQEYEELGVLQTITPPTSTPRPAAAATETAAVQRAPLNGTQKVLMWVAGGLVAVLALVALFLLGQRLGESSVAAPAPATTSATSAVPTPAASGVAATPGSHPWNALQGGECIQPFTSAWAATFTVVDCGASHSAQLVFTGVLPDASGAPYPSGAQFQKEITPLCTATTALNYSAAKAVTDLQVSFSYPGAENDWNSGDRTYYCFVSRAGGAALTANLAPTSN
jgi:hypothetical protein